jgi:branched-chain amino acid transport system ATP-binding protein
MSRPQLIMMDEPSLGLAPFLVEELFRIIRRINKAGMTILLVEQNARAALQIADYGYVLETGQIVPEGRVDELARDEGVRKTTSDCERVPKVAFTFPPLGDCLAVSCVCGAK